MICPYCGGPVLEAAPEMSPRYACADPECPFAHGWETKVEDGKIVYLMKLASPIEYVHIDFTLEPLARTGQYPDPNE